MEWATRAEIIAACATEPERVADALLASRREVQELSERVRELERQLHQNSGNSHKPPSSDGYGKPAPKSLRDKSSNASGGQPGHPGHHLQMVEAPDQVVHHRPASCRHCGRTLADVASVDSERRQVCDLVAHMEVTEHQAHRVHCPDCGEVNAAAFPDGVTQPTQYGSNIKSFVTYCNVGQFIPSDRLQELIYDLTGHNLSEGTLYNVNNTLYERLAPYEEQVKAQLIAAPVAHFDETGLRVDGKLHWLHSCGTARMTHYTVHRRRGKEGMDAAGVLPSFTGVAVHDGLPAYRKFLCEHGLCNVHHRRELVAVIENVQQPWAKDMSNLLLKLNATKEQAIALGKDHLDAECLDEFAQRYDAIIQQGLRDNPLPTPSVPPRRGRVRKTKTRNLLERLDHYREDVLRFAYDFRVPFSNNQAERDVRMVKVQQKVSGAFRTLNGAKTFCRIRGYISTLRKHGLSVMSYLRDAFEGHPFIPQS